MDEVIAATPTGKAVSDEQYFRLVCVHLPLLARRPDRTLRAAHAAPAPRRPHHHTLRAGPTPHDWSHAHSPRAVLPRPLAPSGSLFPRLLSPTPARRPSRRLHQVLFCLNAPAAISTALGNIPAPPVTTAELGATVSAAASSAAATAGAAAATATAGVGAAATAAIDASAAAAVDTLPTGGVDFRMLSEAAEAEGGGFSLLPFVMPVVVQAALLALQVNHPLLLLSSQHHLTNTAALAAATTTTSLLSLCLSPLTPSPLSPPRPASLQMLLAWYVTRKPVVLKLVNTAIGGVEAKLNDNINARVREGVEEAFGEALPKVRAKLDEFVSTAKAGIVKGEKALEMAVGVDKLTDAAEAAKAKVEAAASEGAEKVLQRVEESRAKLRCSHAPRSSVALTRRGPSLTPCARPLGGGRASRDQMEERIKKSAATVKAMDDPSAALGQMKSLW